MWLARAFVFDGVRGLARMVLMGGSVEMENTDCCFCFDVCECWATSPL